MSDIYLTGEGYSYTVRAGARLVSRGVSGKVTFGSNVHSWVWSGPGVHPYGGVNMDKCFADLGAKAMRISNGPQFTVDAAIAAGMEHVIICRTSIGDLAGVKACAAANVKHGDKVTIECGNEPQYLTSTAQQYATSLAAFSAAAKAGNSNVRVSALQTNASYTDAAQNYLKKFALIPGVYDTFSVGNFHPYNYSPEKSWARDIVRVIDVLGPMAPDMEFILGEIGYTNATGRMLNPLLENPGGNMQPLEVAADYYSRYIPIARASRKVRSVCFYSLVDEGPLDPALLLAESHFGLYRKWGDPKPAVAICKDLFRYAHAATDAWMYTRSEADWFVKLAVPGGNVLIAWTIGAPRDVDIKCIGPAVWNVAGDTVKTPFTGTVQLGRRSVVIASDVPIDFPEFPPEAM